MKCPMCGAEPLSITSAGCDSFDLDHYEGEVPMEDQKFSAFCKTCDVSLDLHYKLIGVSE